MKANNKQNSNKKGMTLLELTVVILVLLTLISVLFIGAKAWKDGADRSNCILNIRNFQVAVRSYANMRGTPNYAAAVGATPAVGEINVADLLGAESFLASFPVCPSSGTYTPAADGSIEYTTSTGVAFLTCDSNAGGAHAPNSTSGW